MRKCKFRNQNKKDLESANANCATKKIYKKHKRKLRKKRKCKLRNQKNIWKAQTQIAQAKKSSKAQFKFCNCAICALVCAYPSSANSNQTISIPAKKRAVSPFTWFVINPLWRRLILFAFQFAATTCLHVALFWNRRTFAVRKWLLGLKGLTGLIGLIGVLALMGKNAQSNGEYGKFEGVWESMDGGEFLADREVASSMGEIWKEWRSVERCFGGGVEKCVWGVRRVGKYGEV